MTELHLKLRNKRTGLILQPDNRYPNMWRIHYNGGASDLINLTRAKEAAIGWVRPKGLGPNEAAQWDSQ